MNVLTGSRRWPATAWRRLLELALPALDELGPGAKWTLGGGAALAAAGETLLISPADLPAIQPATIRQLLDALRHSDKSLAVPVYQGKRGHPLALSPTRIPELLHLDLAIGLKQILGQEEDVLRVEVDDPGINQDVDTPEDFESVDSLLRGETWQTYMTASYPDISTDDFPDPRLDSLATRR